jgi:hypothetical protein
MQIPPLRCGMTRGGVWSAEKQPPLGMTSKKTATERERLSRPDKRASRKERLSFYAIADASVGISASS